jgi:ATP-binding cassette subfamily B protein
MAKVINEQKKHTPAPRAQVFTDEEVIGLEQSFIDSYLSSDPRPIRILFRIYRRFWRELLVSMFFYFLKTSPVLALPIVTSNIINVVAYETGDMVVPHLLMNIGVMVLLLLLNIPTHMLYVRYHSMVVRRVEAGLRGAMVRKLQQLSITFHKEMQSGRIQSKLMRDVETVQSLSDQIFSNIPGVLINMITALIVVITTQPTMFVFFMLCIPTAVATVRLFRNGISRRNSEYRQNMETASAGLMDMVEMTQITRAHALENREIKKMTARLNEVANTGFRLDMVQALFGSCSWVVFNIFQLVCLVFSSYMAWQGAIQVGDISLYQSYFSLLTGQVSAIIGMLPIITKGLESVRSIGEILSNTDIEDNTGKIKMTSLRGEYEFRGVHFHYEDDQPLLRGLDLHVREGETIAIVGESGSGKSTILNLVIGFNLAQEGQVLVDGLDIKEIDLHSYRKHIAIVPQNSVLFTGTIRENITYGIKNVTDELIARALEAARLTSFINTLPRGVDTMLEEHGANLSGGQRQRLSIARAIIRDPDVIILDEATSALDSISEKEIQHAINNLTKNRTTFIVAHRLSTIRDADRIAVIKGGMCVEIGSYEELMAAQGEFYRMQTAQ